MVIAMDDISVSEKPEVRSRSVTVLGATGSVGCNTLDIVGRDDAFEVIALTANRNVERLAEQALTHRAKLAVVRDEACYLPLKAALSGQAIEVAAGSRAVAEAAELSADVVVAAIVGAAGLEATFAAARRGCTVALANKECLVAAGALFNAELARAGSTVLPVDSEHSAIFQVFETDRRHMVEKVILTASGGPFRTWSADRIAAATLEDALQHPNWSMGAKITIDSATMMNKGLELIEAYHLFGLETGQIEILVHPQSIIHSMVAYRDGSVLAQLGEPDMRTPIAVALAWPQRMETPVPTVDLAAVSQLTFEAPDVDRFPALRLAREALINGGSAPIVLNAANELAVAAFLERRIGFTEIIRAVGNCLERADGRNLTAMPTTIEEVLDADLEARVLARAVLDLD